MCVMHACRGRFRSKNLISGAQVSCDDDSKVCNVEKSRYKMFRVQNKRWVRYIGDYALQAEFFEPCTPRIRSHFDCSIVEIQCTM